MYMGERLALAARCFHAFGLASRGRSGPLQDFFGMLGKLVDSHGDLHNVPALAPHDNRDRRLRFTLQTVLPPLAMGIAFEPAKLADMLRDLRERVIISGTRAVEILDELDRSGIVALRGALVFIGIWGFRSRIGILFRRLIDDTIAFRRRLAAAWTSPLGLSVCLASLAGHIGVIREQSMQHVLMALVLRFASNR
jgi:hypothetical protein